MQLRADLLLEDLHLARGELLCASSDRVELLARAHPVRRRAPDAGRELFPQARHSNLEELVEVSPDDRQESSPLERRPGLVLGAGEDARVVVERGQLAVQEPRLDRDIGLRSV